MALAAACSASQQKRCLVKPCPLLWHCKGQAGGSTSGPSCQARAHARGQKEQTGSRAGAGAGSSVHSQESRLQFPGGWNGSCWDG